RQLGAGTLATHPRASEAVPAITTATGDVGIDALAGELRRRAGLSELGATFSAIGFDPNASDRRTFWLVVLSLLVCIVGIVNTMMMAVTERFREIATMKCLGAMDSFILKSFLIESGAMGAVGAMLGAVIGVLVVLLQASGRFGGVFWSALPIAPLAGAAGFALICGLALSILGALLPALKAARMHPIEAMRVDA
ncbi:MAG: ABC transporter permease, partial [Planctomycetes bacterium]|nr:ABC transporter permease [Planctomycetota bacterium]